MLRPAKCTSPAQPSCGARWASVIRADYTPPRSCALSEDLPIIIEIVDAEEKITAFLSELDGMIGSGLVTLEKVKVLRYGTSEKA